jgi:hypothetical protein
MSVAVITGVLGKCPVELRAASGLPYLDPP